MKYLALIVLAIAAAVMAALWQLSPQPPPSDAAMIENLLARANSAKVGTDFAPEFALS